MRKVLWRPILALRGHGRRFAASPRMGTRVSSRNASPLGICQACQMALPLWPLFRAAYLLKVR